MRLLFIVFKFNYMLIYFDVTHKTYVNVCLNRFYVFQLFIVR